LEVGCHHHHHHHHHHHIKQVSVRLFLESQVPNRLSLKRELLEGSYLAKYKVRNRSYHIYRAAARLWTAGLAWKTALDIVTESFDAATYDPDADT